MIIARTDREIEEVMQEVEDQQEEGTKFEGMTYEEGITALYDWLVGHMDESPMDE